MGRGRVQLKRIENKINRQVTFSKRRHGLLKKANEISVLCDAQVALIVFSTKGKLYEYATESCMSKILERYESYCYAEKELVPSGPDSEGNWCQEYGKLKAKVDGLQRNIRHFMGEDLDSFSVRELQQLEQQLDAALRHVRTRKNQVVVDSIADLQRKEKALQEQNSVLEKKLQEKEKAATQQAHQSQPSLMLTSPLPTLNIGSYSMQSGIAGAGAAPAEGARPPARNNSVVPPWMLRHMNE